jgi:hypothetical protein
MKTISLVSAWNIPASVKSRPNCRALPAVEAGHKMPVIRGYGGSQMHRVPARINGTILSVEIGDGWFEIEGTESEI